MDPNIYAKMLKVRAAENLNLKASRFLRSEIEYKGKKIPFSLRNYQIQMVFHTLLSKRFIIGDDTGLGKCQIKNSLISTNYGLVPIGDMHDWSGMKPETFEPIDREWNVLVDGEELPVKNFYYGGVKPTVKMRTRYNFEVEGSRVHPLLVWRDCGHQWVEMQDLQEGDYICVERREMGFPEVEPALNTDVSIAGNSKAVTLPAQVTPEFARWTGYLVSEGWFNHAQSFSISQGPEVNPEVHADIAGLTADLFGRTMSDVKDKFIHSTTLISYLTENGVSQGVAKDKSVPDFILRSTRESNIEFLRGLFEGEGHVLSSGGIEFSTASEELGRQVQIMLTRFGIVCNRSVKKVKGYEHNTYWRLTLFGEDARVYRDKIGFVSSRKIDALGEALDRPANANHDVIPNCKPLIESLRGLLKEVLSAGGNNALRIGSGFKQYGTSFVNTLNHIRNAGRNPTYDFLDKLLNVCADNGLNSTSEYVALDKVARTRYFYDPVVSLVEGQEEVFDIEVDDPRHCFVSNGIVNHNTLEAITTIAALWQKDPDLKVIVVTNTSVMNQWGGEINKFTQGIKWRISKGGPEKRSEIYEDYFSNWDNDEPEVLIVNYHRLRRDKRVFKAFSEGHRYCLILDEVTAVKNPESQTHHVFRELSNNADRVYGLTATLIKNNLEEGFGIYKVVVPNLFRTKQGFYRNYCVTRMQRIPGSKRKIPVIIGHSRKHIQDFKTAIDPYYLGRAKQDVADELPVLTVKDISMPMEKSQYIFYQEALEGLLTLNQGTEDEEEREVTKLTSLIYCQEIVDSPVLIGNDVKSGKETYFLELLKEELADEKVIVFTRFKSMVNRLQELLEKDGYKVGIKAEANKEWSPEEDKTKVPKGLVRITGDESPEQRDAGRQAFVESENTNLIFLTMAGAEAINLQAARVMVFYDLPWSAGDYIQLVGRMIRIGSPHDRVYALHLLSETPEGYKTIDHHVRETLQKKMGYIEQALGERLVQEGSEVIRTATEHDEEEIISIESTPVSSLFDRMIDDARNGEKKNDD